MIIQNVSRKTHILSFLRRKPTDKAIVLGSGQAVDLAAQGYKDEELKNIPQLNILLSNGEIVTTDKMPEISRAAIEKAKNANRQMEREQIIEKIKSTSGITLIEYYQDKAKANNDNEIYQMCVEKLAELK